MKPLDKTEWMEGRFLRFHAQFDVYFPRCILVVKKDGVRAA
jgi:hypothetical protein